ncbi:MAG: hypothetical protein JSR71_04935 [Proteobacteria bacterium]|nr:hypothetical protein [Pseudomonadota bacterium]
MERKTKLAIEQEVKTAFLKLQEALARLADALLLAPFDGIIVKRLKQPGDMGMLGVPVVMLQVAARSQAGSRSAGRLHRSVRFRRNGGGADRYDRSDFQRNDRRDHSGNGCANVLATD